MRGVALSEHQRPLGQDHLDKLTEDQALSILGVPPPENGGAASVSPPRLRRLIWKNAVSD